MRKWTQQIKLTLSESIKVDVENKLRLELNEANPDEPFTDQFTDEHRQIIDKRLSEKFDERLMDTY